MTCPGRTVDKWRTVWRCTLEEDHADPLCRDGVMQFDGGLRVREAYALRVRPVEFFRWIGAASREEFEQFLGYDVAYNINFDSAVLRGVRRGDRIESTMQILPGEWMVYYSDCTLEVIAGDRFERLYQEVPR